MGESDSRPTAPPDITSRHNARLKQAIGLRDSRRRRASGRFLIDGAREALRALEAGVTPVEAFVSVEASGPRVAETTRVLAAAGVPTVRVAADPFAKLAYGDRADGVVLVATVAATDLATLLCSGGPLPERALVLVVEAVEKPGNLGAILRTADGAGVDAVIVADPRVDRFHPNVLRASVGAALRDNLVVTDAESARAWLGREGFTTIVTRPDATEPYIACDLTRRVAIVVGSEANGLTPAWDDLAGVQAVSLPMRGVADSLNVSAATAVLLYEARRQRDAYDDSREG